MKNSFVGVVAVLLFVAASLVCGSPTKPVWPLQFDVPFGLNAVLPPIRNATSHLYYDWTIPAQMIDYPERCFPFAHWDSGFHPCQLYFNQTAVYVVAPSIGIDCCTLAAGVGPVPPTFLQGFNYSSVEDATDWWGNEHQCNYWLGALDFGYWTDATTNHDVQFRDGPSGVEWHFGHFTDQNQTASLFQPPAADCSSSCGFLFAKDNAKATQDEILLDPFIRWAIMNSKN